MEISPYVVFNGECETAFEFYEQCLDGKITAKVTYGETPMADQVPSEWRTKIIHASIKMGDMVLMGGDPTPGSYVEPRGFSLFIAATDPAEAEHIFFALSEKGTVVMPLQETFWTARFGRLIDKFGIPWMITCVKSA
jgi:PhnB protein